MTTTAAQPHHQTTSQTIRVHTTPPTHGFLQAAQRHFDALPNDVKDARAELGLPTDRPVVLTGHQPIFFHPGILAKDIAAAAIAHHASAHAAHIIVDHDTVDPFTVDAPAEAEHALPHPVRVRLADPVPPGIASLQMRARKGHENPQILDTNHPLHQQTLDRLTAAARTIDAHAHQPNAALQAAHANADLLRAHAHLPSTPASHLTTTSAWHDTIHRLAAHPQTRSVYNDAVRAHPDAGVAPLDLDNTDNPELPLWRIDNAGRRARARLKDLNIHETPHNLRPRALLMTAILRTVFCDLFIHGVGGATYDRITDRWLAACAPTPHNTPGRTHAPAHTATVSADAYLPGEPTDTVTPAEVHNARWRAHHARHHPAVLGDHAHQRERDRLAAAVRNATDRRARRAHFRQLHEFLHHTALANAHELRNLDNTAERLERIALWQRANRGRTWPAFLYPASTLHRLAEQVRLAVIQPN